MVKDHILFTVIWHQTYGKEPHFIYGYKALDIL